MTLTANSPQNTFSSDDVIAKIDSLDLLYSEPLREYLHGNGVRVFVNQDIAASLSYHFIVGDEEFVKSILENVDKRTAHVFIVLWDGEDTTFTTGRVQNLKVALVDAIPLTKSVTEKLLEFFFTSSEGFKTFRSPNDQVWLQMRRKNVSEEQEYKGTDGVVEHLSIGNEASAKIQSVSTSYETGQDDIRIADTIASVFKKQESTGGKAAKHQKIKKYKTRGAWLFILFAVVTPILWYGASVIIGVAMIWMGLRAIDRGEMNVAKNTSAMGRYWVRLARGTLDVVVFPFKPLILLPVIRGQERFTSFLLDVVQAQEKGVQLYADSQLLASEIIGERGPLVESNESLPVLLDRVSATAPLVGNAIGLAEAEMAALIRDQIFPFRFIPRERLDTLRFALRELSNGLEFFSHVLSLYPQLGGFREEKSYLVLLQNSMELRPTGGFIGSIGIINVADGKVKTLDVQDVYALDGQLKGHVDPPTPIAEILRQEHWYLRDSNWDPDFPTAARQALWFYEKETGQTVDGVIAVNSRLFVDLLRVIGPIQLADYNDTITADNFFIKSFYYTQENFFPGSTQKKDFLGKLMTSFMTSVMSEKKGSALAIARVLHGAILKRDILISVNQQESGQFIEHIGWSGRFPERLGCARHVDLPCSFDSFHVSEANLSINKANYFVKRTQRTEITYDESRKASYLTTLSYNNASVSDSGGGGVYRTYLRLYLPRDATVSDVTLNGQKISTKPRVPLGKIIEPPYVETPEERSFASVLGIALDVPIGGETSLRVQYTRDGAVHFENNRAHMEFFMQAQPGRAPESVVVVFRFPSTWKIDHDVPVLRSAFLANELVLSYNSIESGDTKIDLELSR